MARRPPDRPARAAGAARPRLVHLNALRAFEAAVRQQSFAAAAEELHVTASAVGQLVRSLEDYLGQRLFERLAEGVRPSEAARAAYPQIRDGLAQLASGLDRLRADRAACSLRISVPPSLATQWLLPRLLAFRRAHPQIELHIDSSGRLVDLQAEGFDAAIRYGRGVYPGLHGELLLREQLFPVAAPQLLAELSPDADPLRALPLIEDTTIDYEREHPHWADWFARAGGAGPFPRPTLSMGSSLQAIAAAVAGAGVLLARSVLVEEELRQGRLCRLSALALDTPCAYWLLTPPQASTRDEVQRWREWLQRQCEPISAADPSRA